MTTAAAIIAKLGLKPHPEGGHYRETFRDTRTVDGRATSTAILFLLARGERSHWHRVDAVEIWHYRAGARLAGGGKSRRLDAVRLHGGAGFRVLRLRTGAEGLEAAQRNALEQKK